jgi:hypothetical protein
VKRIVTILILLAALPIAAYADAIEMELYMIPQLNASIYTAGSAQYLDAAGNPKVIGMSGNLTNYQENQGVVAYDPWIVYTGNWSGDMLFDGYWSTCYAASLSAHGGSVPNRPIYTPWACTRPEPFPYPREREPIRLADISLCPLVFDLGRGASYSFSDAAGGVLFDMDNDSAADRVAWPTGSVAFLFFDRNGNGVPDNGSELFGNATPLRSGEIAKHGFDALSELDGDFDGAITPADAAWSSLRVWHDADRSGSAAAQEIATLDAAGIRSIETSAIWTARQDRGGNWFRWEATFVFDDGRGAAVRRPFYDVWLAEE